MRDVEHWSVAVNARLKIRPARRGWFGRHPAPPPGRVDWMPASRYAPAWPGMRAYAEPAYYDARVRVNLEGREAHGLVPLAKYSEALDEVEQLIRACTDPRSGEPLSIEVDRREQGDPRERADTDADLVVRFRKDYYAFQHRRLGTIGPVPCRRTGGHTGGLGVGWYRAEVPGGTGGTKGGTDLGRFATLEVPHAVRALVQGEANGCTLGAALLGAGSV
jgi:hypothetical protein